MFSNVAGVEAAYKRLRGVTLDLSEQYMNAVRRTLELKVPASAAALPRAENLPASWGAGGSWDLQIYYMRQAGIPAEGFAPYVPHENYEMTNQEGDVPRTPADWQDYFNGR